MAYQTSRAISALGERDPDPQAHGRRAAPRAPASTGDSLSDHCPPGVPIVANSPGMHHCLRCLRLVAESRCNPVLITGETGTGKELAARGVHAWRCGPAEPYVPVNCAALTAHLLESELFGHVRGAFTGAERRKQGLFDLAGEGTLFLDEISEMPVELQPKLLRVLQEQTYREVGGTETHTCRATVVASSNRDLLAAVRAGTFRKDLYYRLAVFPIELPPLRSTRRQEDIPLLAGHFARTSAIAGEGRIRGLTPEAERALLRHDWPGNVRELRNVIDRAVLLEGGDWITPESLVLDGDGAEPPRNPVDPPDPTDFSLETAERVFILRALRETGWQRTRAASLLGITRATLYAKLKRYGIQPPQDRPQEACA